MSGTLRLRGSTSGYAELQAAAVAGDQTFILPAVGGTLLTTDSPVGNLTLELGSASQPSLRFEGDTDTGLFSSGANTLNLVTGGSNKLVLGATSHTIFSGTNGSVRAVDIDSNGSVLIGTATSNANDRLTILDPGDSFVSIRSTAAADATSQILDFGVGTGDRASTNLTGTIQAVIHSQSGGTLKSDLKFHTNAGNNITQKMVIKDTGNVGINTTNPTAKLHTVGTVLHEGDVEIRPENTGGEGGQITLKNPDKTSTGATIDVSSANAFRIFQLNNDSVMELGQLSGTGGVIRLATGGSTSVCIDSSKRLLVGGHTSGSYQLEVVGSGNQTLLVGSTNATGAMLVLDGDSNGDGSGSDYASILHGADGNLEINNRKDADILFKAGASETLHATIKSNGNFLVGTVSADGGTKEATTVIGSCLIHSTGIISVSTGGTLDLSSRGNSIVGHLYVHSVYTLNAAARTSKIFFIAGRGTNGFTATELNSNTGSAGGSSFTITNPSSNILRFTNTSGSAVSASMSFVGSMGF